MRRNPNYIFENSTENEMVFNCMMRSLESEVSYESQLEWIQSRHRERIKRIQPEIVERWLKALRSDKYKQEPYYLRGKGNYYSCLGVLLEITKDITGGEWHGNGYWFKPKTEEFTKDVNQECFNMPRFAYDKLGMKWHLKKLHLRTNCLAELNTMLDFKRLADIIESEYLINKKQ